jgi:hypothetical protein
MFASLAAAALIAQLGSPVHTPSQGEAFVLQTQYRVYAHPPPCGDGFDLSARDGLCYPNGYLAPQDQAARRISGARVSRWQIPGTVRQRMFGMANVTPTAPCHRNFNRAGSIAARNMTRRLLRTSSEASLLLSTVG